MSARQFDWSLCRTFLALARRGSIAGAGVELGHSHPTMRRQLGRLEAAMGATLFTRSQDGVRLTPIAKRLLPHAERVEAAAEAMLRAGDWEDAAGTLRIGAARLIGLELLPRVLEQVRAGNPRMRFELALGDDLHSVLRLQADVAVTDRRPERDGLVAIRAATLLAGYFASSGWLKRFGPPRGLEDLEARGALVGGGPSADAIAAIEPRSGGGAYSLRTSDGAAALGAIAAGMGVGELPLIVASRRPGLVRVLPERESAFDVWIVMHPDLRTVPPVRVMIDALKAHLRELEVEDAQGRP